MINIEKLASINKSFLAIAAFVAVTSSASGEDNAKRESAKAPEKIAEDSAETRAIMDSIFAPLSRVLPKSFDGNEFAAAKNRAAIQADLSLLAENAKSLEKHGKDQTRNFEYIARSLARDARNTKRWYERGNFEEARFTLHNMTENCVACHSSLPSTVKFTGTDAFFKSVHIDKLPLLEKAHLQVMTRQYPQALTSYEQYLASVSTKPEVTIASGTFIDYLKVAICAAKDGQRPIGLMEKLDARLEKDRRASNLLKNWIAVLKQNKDLKITGTDALNKAKSLVKDAQSKMDFPGDKAAMMQLVVAESFLFNFVESSKDWGADVGEAYYNLGVAESVLEHGFWLTKADFYLESAIRLAPAKPFAHKAYAMLEDNLVTGFTGSGGTNLPDDVEELLRELRRIMAAAQAKG